MKTGELIEMLASGPDLYPEERSRLRSGGIIAAALLVSFTLMYCLLGLRSNLLQELSWPAFWSKLLFMLALATGGCRVSWRLTQPGAASVRLALWIGVPLLLLWALATYSLWGVESAARAALFWGTTWRSCPALITLLALPILAAILWVMRGLAPTRLRLAGAAAGFAAGALSAAVYCLHCPELASAFVGFWYLLGISLSTGLGAAVGRRVLAW